MIRTAAELASACLNVATNFKTLYIMGCFGAPMNSTNKARYCNNHKFNRDATRRTMIQAASSNTFGFDCVGLIKGLLWGWNGSSSKTYGGAKYAANGVPDTNADGMITLCKDVSTDFSNIDVGEIVWMQGHIGVYIGDGLAVECTPKWENCVQITAVHNISKKTGQNGRSWVKHGKLPYVSYDAIEDISASDCTSSTDPEKTVEELAREVIRGKWGNGQERRRRLADAGYDYAAVQAVVNKMVR